MDFTSICRVSPIGVEHTVHDTMYAKIDVGWGGVHTRSILPKTSHYSVRLKARHHPYHTSQQLPVCM